MRTFYISLVTFFFGATLFAQVGINTSQPDDKSVLDLHANDKGLLIPRLTSIQRETMGNGGRFAQGMMVYDTDLDILFVGYGNGASGNTKWYAMNPWKTEYRTENNAITAHTTAMTATGIKHGNIGIGKTNPTEKLHVGGKVKATEFIGNGTTPIGGIIMWSGSTAPVGWALCNGGKVNGYKTPNLKGRFVVGYDNGDANYNNPGDLSTKGTGSSNVGGAKEVVLTNNQMPRHNHGGSTEIDGIHSHKFKLGYEDDDSGGGGSYNEYTFDPGKTTLQTETDGVHSHAINPDGGTSAHENRPPYYTLAYIMRVY